MPRQAVNSGRGRAWLIAIVCASLLSACYLLLTPGDRVSEHTVGANGFSRSAIGHYGLLQLLDELGERVLRQRSRMPRNAGLLVLSEPGASDAKDVDLDDEWELLADRIDAAAETLLILPKRTGEADELNISWLQDAGLIALPKLRETLAGMPTDRFPEVLRVDQVRTWQCGPGLPLPSIAGPVQLFAHDEAVQPVIECRDGVLLGYLDDREYPLWVMSDPDVFANHGLLRGDNAALAVAILRRVRGDGAILFDETLHGFAQEPSIYHLAREFPVIVITVHLLLLMALVAFAAIGRFGPVQPPAVVIASGKGHLIDSVVSLQRRAGHHESSLRRYAAMCVRQAAARLRAPKGLDHEQSLQWLLQRESDEQVCDELQGLLASRHVARTERDVATTARRIKELTARIGNAS